VTGIDRLQEHIISESLKITFQLSHNPQKPPLLFGDYSLPISYSTLTIPKNTQKNKAAAKQRQPRMILVPFSFHISISEVNHGCCSKEKDKCFWNVLEMEVTVTLENRGQYSDDKGNNGKAPP
jgi:hypothetical protein